MEPMMYVAVTFASLNTVILLWLLYVYARIGLRAKAAYPLGLIAFALLLLLQNLLTAISYVEMYPFLEGPILPYLAVVSVLEFGGLLALTRVTI